EFVLDALEVIEPRDLAVELGAFLFGKLGLHFGDCIGELGTIEILQRHGDVGEHRETSVRHLRKAARHDDLFLLAAGNHGQDAGPHHGNDRSMSGQHAEIALEAGNIDLVHLAGKGELLGRDEIEVECGHGITLSAVTRCTTRGSISRKKTLLSMDCRVEPGNDDSLLYAASAASFLPFSTASSMVPTM